MRNILIHPDELQTDDLMLLIFSPTPQDRTFKIQMEQFDNLRVALLEHHIVLGEVFEGLDGHIGSENLPPEVCQNLRRRFDIPDGRFSVMLVDGESQIKLIADSCVSYEEIVMRVENEYHHQA